MKKCEWCESSKIQAGEETVFWELPDGSRAITITDAPSIHCFSCTMNYQSQQTIKEIEDQLLLINTGLLPETISYKSLLEQPRLLKRNYFDFS
ncbi:YokU family protein [Metabacillus sp. GX 13764]|uniref:YokU family protein n=1 Tax=Metabacillus kandeliae TaxID=2900151 RepID=UPI001E2B09CF|nr:YokU family protein [Metabacillus kandeliae]MCD7033490.1 YokU family protein [Metabacillus kandeliae]